MEQATKRMEAKDRNATRLFYIVQGELFSGGVIEAQVIATLRAHSRILGQPKTRLIFLEPARVAFGEKARAAVRKYRRLWPEGRISIVPYVSRLGDSSPGKFLAAYLMRERLTSSNIVFHCRGSAAARSAHLARGVIGRGRIIFDLRGPYPYETIHRLGFPFEENLSAHAQRSYQICMDSERRAISVADHVFTVSAGLKTYAVEIGNAPEDHVTVVPSCVEETAFDECERARVRAAWGVENIDSPVFVYSGRLARERLPSHMFRVFSAMLRLRPDAKMVIFSDRNSVENAGLLMKDAGVPESKILLTSASRDDLIRQMCGADAGMLFLEPALRFRECSPIKFAEYLSAGLSVIINSMVGRLPDLVRSRRLGWIIDQEADDSALEETARNIISEIADDREALRKRSLAVCEEMYLWRNYIAAIRSAYDGIES